MFEKLKSEIEKCRDCEEKFGFEPHPIFWGKQNSKIVQISQAPSIVLPHPSPLNKKWLKEHPDFMNKRIIEVRKMIKEIIKN